MDNRPAYLQIGGSEGTVTGTMMGAMGTESRTITYRNVGTSVQFVPRVGADGRVTMDIDISHSGIGPSKEGVVVHVPKTGEPVHSPNMEQMTAQCTISAPSGKTIAVGGHSKRPREYVILVTPRILRMDGSSSPR